MGVAVLAADGSALVYAPVLRVLDLYCLVAICQQELETCTSRTLHVLQSCDFPARAANLYFAHQTCTTKLRFSSWSRKPVLRVLDLHFKVAIFQQELETSALRTRLVLQSCDFPSACRMCATKLQVSSWSWTLRFAH